MPDKHGRTLGESHDELYQFVLFAVVVRDLDCELGKRLPQAPHEMDGRWHENIGRLQVPICRKHIIQTFCRHVRCNGVADEIQRDVLSDSVHEGLVKGSIKGEVGKLVMLDFAIVAEGVDQNHINEEGDKPDGAGREAEDHHCGQELEEIDKCTCDEVGD